jgi:hypothetical protein
MKAVSLTIVGYILLRLTLLLKVFLSKSFLACSLQSVACFLEPNWDEKFPKLLTRIQTICWEACQIQAQSFYKTLQACMPEFKLIIKIDQFS